MEARRHTPAGAEELKLNGVQVLEAALGIHDELVRAAGETPAIEPLRQRAESRSVLGRVMLSNVVDRELAGQLFTQGIRSDGLAVITRLLEPAKKDIDTVEILTGQTDQHRINMMSRLSMAHSMYGRGAWAKNTPRKL